jgi:hypothetical protein
MKNALLTFVFFWLSAMSSDAAAQESGGAGTESGEIRRAVGRILESQEFRHFKRLRNGDGTARRRQKGNDSFGEGTSGNEQSDDDSNSTEDSSGFGAGSLG